MIQDIQQELAELRRYRRAEQLARDMQETGNAAMRRLREQFQEKWGEFYRCRKCGDRVDARPIFIGSKVRTVCECDASAKHSTTVESNEDFERKYRKHSYTPPPSKP